MTSHMCLCEGKRKEKGKGSDSMNEQIKVQVGRLYEFEFEHQGASPLDFLSVVAYFFSAKLPLWGSFGYHSIYVYIYYI